jgi:3-hydroxyisobutyrate dehydrogenase-like beta-hydroxyacid dehydrogenase
MPAEQSGPPTIAVLGLGEAGSAIAQDLVAAGAAVRGYDPAVLPPEGVVGAAHEADAATGADLVLSVNSAKAALDALRAGCSGLRAGAVWADLNTASPGLKRSWPRWRSRTVLRSRMSRSWRRSRGADCGRRCS